MKFFNLNFYFGSFLKCFEILKQPLKWSKKLKMLIDIDKVVGEEPFKFTASENQCSKSR